MPFSKSTIPTTFLPFSKSSGPTTLLLFSKSTIPTTFLLYLPFQQSSCHFLNLPFQLFSWYFLNLPVQQLACHFLNPPFQQHSRYKFNYPRFFMAVSHYKYNAGTQAILALLTSGNYFPATLLYTVYKIAYLLCFLFWRRWFKHISYDLEMLSKAQSRPETSPKGPDRKAYSNKLPPLLWRLE